MTTTAVPPTRTDSPALTRDAAAPRAHGHRTMLRAALHYVIGMLRITLSNFAYSLFTIVMPVVMYVIFSQMWGSEQVIPGVNYSALIMVQMAAYGAIGAAMNGGAVIAMERRSGWFRQLSLTVLPAPVFLAARALVVLIMVLPSLLLVSAAGIAVGGVSGPPSVWAVSMLSMWASLLPLTVLGLVIGLMVKGEAVGGVNTLVLLVLTMVGGLWFPVQTMPTVLQVISRAMPSYWVGEFGRNPWLGQAVDPTGVLVLLGWLVATLVIGAMGYRRAVRTSKR